mmetsp:Transcript_11818/g.36419  ORF Transcript_11818/g.36419 Transcript_11818/m.36419 type:complete len:110 (+) Transcript_11818:250-579(+)
MRRRYTVRGKKGLLVRAGPALDSEVVATLPAGSEVIGATTSEFADDRRRLRIQEPVQGWCAPRLLETGDVVEGFEDELGLPPRPDDYPCTLHVPRPVTERRAVATVAMG